MQPLHHPLISTPFRSTLTSPPPLPTTATTAVVSAGLVESEAETCFGCGKFKGSEAEKNVMVIAAANPAAKTVSLSVRAESAELKQALESQLLLLLNAKK